MGIDPELLTKAAKVYEAAESVEGMKPKEVYESHKKCAPGEFNMNKEGYAKLQQAITKVARQKRALDSVDIAHGMTIGGPAVFTPGRTALMGAGGGGAAGAGLGGLLGALYGAYNPGDENTHNAHGEVVGQKQRGRLHGALRGLAAGGVLGGGAGAALGGSAGYINSDLLERTRKQYELEQLQNAR